MRRPKLIMISHTHWDREWYYTFDKFRYRLVRCLDAVLDILSRDRRFHSFTLDGQVAPLDDYLELRPERAEEVRRRVREGRLIIGPWYVQPDEFLVGEESLVRNLLYGRLRGSEYGRVMRVGYLPDTFGHTAQLPQILRGFNIDVFIFHRGMGPEFEEVGTPFIWRGPDGSEVIALFLYGGYCNMAWLSPDAGEAAEMIKELYKRWRKYMRAPVIPGMVGCDHHLPREYVPRIAGELAEMDLPVDVAQGSLKDLAEELRRVAGGLKRHEGELLSSHYHWVLYGTWSTRTYLKQLNFECETLLTYYVEPLWTLAWLLGSPYPEAEIWAAWRYVLLSHPHDSICGCSTDEVHREVEARLVKARELARELLYCTGREFGTLSWFLAGRAGYRYEWHALPLIASKADLSFAGSSTLYVVAFNTLPWRRTAVVRMRVRPYSVTTLMLRELARIAPRRVAESAAKLAEAGVTLKVDFRGVSLRDSRGRLVPCQVRELEDGTLEVIWVDELPSMGFKSYALVREPAEARGLSWGSNFIENEYLRVEFNLDEGGSLRVVDKRTGEVYNGLAVLEDGGDVGDEYDYSPPERGEVISSRGCRASFEVVERGPVYLRARVRYTMRVPESASPNRKSRSERRVELPVELYAILYRGVPRVDLEVVVDNRAKDHRLRIVFPTGVRVSKHFAKTHYMVIERPNESPHYYLREGSKAPVRTYPTRLWVDVSDGRKGLCVVAKGLHEYEVRDGEGGTEIVFTLMRCVGWLSRADLLTRPGHAGPQVATPDAQCPGVRRFELSIIPHTGSWLEAGVDKAALEYVVQGVAHEDIPHSGDLSPEHSLLEVKGGPALFSTLKRSIDGRRVVLRLYNPSPEKAEVEVALYRKARRAWRARLDEEEVEELHGDLGVIRLSIPPYKIETLKLEL